MSGTRPERTLDPVGGMTVDVAKAEEVSRTIEHDGRTPDSPVIDEGTRQVAESQEVVAP